MIFQYVELFIYAAIFLFIFSIFIIRIAKKKQTEVERRKIEIIKTMVNTFLSIFISMRVNQTIQNINSYNSYKKLLISSSIELSYIINQYGAFLNADIIDDNKFFVINGPKDPELFYSIPRNIQVTQYLSSEEIFYLLSSARDIHLMIEASYDLREPYKKDSIDKIVLVIRSCFESLIRIASIYDNKNSSEYLPIKENKEKVSKYALEFIRKHKLPIKEENIPIFITWY